MSNLTIPTKIEAEPITRQYMIKAFQITKRNERPCQKCSAIDHGLAIHKSYIRQPCRCCGANDHSMLECTQDCDGNITTVAACPLIEFSDKSLPEQLSLNFLKYRACEEKFAELHGYNIANVTKALDDFEKKGDGSFMIPYYCNQYKQNVIRICEEMRASWTFKRTVTTDEPDEENLEL